MDSAQSLLQTAQFTMVDKLNVIADAVTGQQQFGQLAVGSIVGKEAVYVDALGNQMTGMISSAKITEGERCSSSTAPKCRSTEWSHTPAKR